MPANSSITHKAVAGAAALTVASLREEGVARAIKSVNTAFNNKSVKDNISNNICESNGKFHL
jgi:hypothetical protein